MCSLPLKSLWYPDPKQQAHPRQELKPSWLRGSEILGYFHVPEPRNFHHLTTLASVSSSVTKRVREPLPLHLRLSSAYRIGLWLFIATASCPSLCCHQRPPGLPPVSLPSPLLTSNYSPPAAGGNTKLSQTVSWRDSVIRPLIPPLLFSEAAI